MADFSMQRYYNQYIEAANQAEQVRRRVRSLEDRLHSDPDEDTCHQLQAAQKELQAADQRAAELACLATTGKTQAELQQRNTIRPVGLQPMRHYPAAPRGRRLER